MRLLLYKGPCPSVGWSVRNAFVKIAEIRRFVVSEWRRIMDQGGRRKKQGTTRRRLRRAGRSDEEEELTRRKKRRGGRTEEEESATRGKKLGGGRSLVYPSGNEYNYVITSGKKLQNSLTTRSCYEITELFYLSC